MKNNKKKVLTVLAGVLLAGGAWAADVSDESAVTFTMPGETNGFVLLQGLDDFDFGTFNGVITDPAESTFCLYVSGAGDKISSYTITTSKVDLTSDTNTLAYTTEYDTTGSDGAVSVTGDILTVTNIDNPLLSYDNNLLSCKSDNLKLKVSIDSDAASQAPEGSYSGKIKLTVAAN